MSVSVRAGQGAAGERSWFPFDGCNCWVPLHGSNGGLKAPSTGPSTTQGDPTAYKPWEGMCFFLGDPVYWELDPLVTWPSWSLPLTQRLQCEAWSCHHPAYLGDCRISARWEKRASSKLSVVFIQSWKTAQMRPKPNARAALSISPAAWRVSVGLDYNQAHLQSLPSMSAEP